MEVKLVYYTHTHARGWRASNIIYYCDIQSNVTVDNDDESNDDYDDNDDKNDSRNSDTTCRVSIYMYNKYCMLQSDKINVIFSRIHHCN